MASVRPKRRRPLWIGGWLLFLLPLPLALKVFIALGRGEFSTFLISAIALAVLLLGAWLTRRGLYQEKRRPMSSMLPLKLVGGGIIAVGTALTALIADHNVAIGICFGLASLLGFYLTYGFDKRVKTIQRQGCCRGPGGCIPEAGTPGGSRGQDPLPRYAGPHPRHCPMG